MEWAPDTSPYVEVSEDGWEDHAADLDEDRRELAAEITHTVAILHADAVADGCVWPFEFLFDDDARFLTGDDAIDALESTLPGNAHAWLEQNVGARREAILGSTGV